MPKKVENEGGCFCRPPRPMSLWDFVFFSVQVGFIFMGGLLSGLILKFIKIGDYLSFFVFMCLCVWLGGSAAFALFIHLEDQLNDSCDK